MTSVNYTLRAEILHRCKIPPFKRARDVLEKLEAEHKSGKEDFLTMCSTVPKEVLDLGDGKDEYHPDEARGLFTEWLRCYYKDGMKNVADSNGRTIWFSGPSGPLAPKDRKAKTYRAPAAAAKRKGDSVTEPAKAAKRASSSRKRTKKIKK